MIKIQQFHVLILNIGNNSILKFFLNYVTYKKKFGLIHKIFQFKFHIFTS